MLNRIRNLFTKEPIYTHERVFFEDGQIHMTNDQNVEGSTRTIHTYYPTGEIDTIQINTYNLFGIRTSTRTIKHYLDGRQPHEL